MDEKRGEDIQNFLRRTPKRKEIGDKRKADYDEFIHQSGDEQKARKVVLQPAVVTPRNLTERAKHTDWDDVDNKPDTFPPSSHTHPQYLQGDYDSDYELLVVEK